MKLVQINIWQGRLLQQILSFLSHEQPDIVCMQEVFSCPAAVHLPDNMMNCLEIIQQTLGYDHVFFSPISTMRITDTEATFGNAIVSRLPLEHRQTIFTGGHYVAEHTAKSHIVNNRNLQIAELKHGGATLTLVNHHGYWDTTPLGNATSVEKMRLVKDAVRPLPQPIIMAGDLNITAVSPAMRVFDSFLEDLTATHNIHTTLSQLGKVSGVACDHILVSPGVRVRRFSVKDTLVSDHKPLVLEFDL